MSRAETNTGVMGELYAEVAEALGDEFLVAACGFWRRVGNRYGQDLGNCVSVGSICSSSDLVVPMMEALSGLFDKALANPGVEAATTKGVKFDHAFSCEIEPWKREWIHTHWKPRHIFHDARKLGYKQRQPDDVTLEDAEAPGVDLLWAGFSCVDCSQMNKDKDIWEERFDSGEGATTQTLSGTLSYVDWARPPVVILENVPRFALKGGASGAYRLMQARSAVVLRDDVEDPRFGISPSCLSRPFQDLRTKLRLMGYQVVAILIDCKGYGVPQHRLRLYIICTMQHAPTKHLADLRVQTILDTSVLQMRDIASDFLLDTSTADWAWWNTRREWRLKVDDGEEPSSKRQKQNVRDGWKEDHKERYVLAGMTWPPVYPDNEMLDCRLGVFGERQRPLSNQTCTHTTHTPVAYVRLTSDLVWQFDV